MFKFTKYCLSISSLLAISSIDANIALADASLSFFPYRIIIDGNQRSTSVSLINRGDKKGVYKIMLANKRMAEDGSIQDVSDESKNKEELYAADIVIVRPKRVELEPGESQDVRILVRKRPNTKDGEYRSHVIFSMIRDESDDQGNEKEPLVDNSDRKTVKLKLRSNVAFAIPLIVRIGNLQVKSDVANINTTLDEHNKQHVTFDINRVGGKSIYGDVTVEYIDTKGVAKKIVSNPGVAIYTPNAKRHFDLTSEKGFDAKSGKLRILFQEKEEDGGKILAESLKDLSKP